MMGIALYLIWKTEGDRGFKQTAIILFAVQLTLNFFVVFYFLLCKTTGMGFCRYYCPVVNDIVHNHLVWKNFQHSFLVIGTVYLLGKFCFSFKLLYLEAQLKFVLPHHTFYRLIRLPAVFCIFFLVILNFNFSIYRKIN